MIDPVQYIFLNEALGMTVGKASAQAAHAAIRGYKLTPDDSNLKRLFHRSNHEKTVVLQARDIEQMWTIQEYIRSGGIRSAMVIDEGRTEIQLMTPTAIGVEILDKNHPHNSGIFSEFKLYGVLRFAPIDSNVLRREWKKSPPPPSLLERLKGRIS